MLGSFLICKKKKKSCWITAFKTDILTLQFIQHIHSHIYPFKCWIVYCRSVQQ